MELSIKVENVKLSGTVENGKLTITRREVGKVEVNGMQLALPPSKPPERQIVLSVTDGAELMISASDFAAQVPKGMIARYEVTAWYCEGQYCSPYRLIHYNKGTAKRMSKEALCGLRTGNDMHYFYQNDPLESDPEGGNTDYRLCPECAAALAEDRTRN